MITVENLGMGIIWVGQIWSHELLKTEKEGARVN